MVFKLLIDSVAIPSLLKVEFGKSLVKNRISSLALWL